MLTTIPRGTLYWLTVSLEADLRAIVADHLENLPLSSVLDNAMSAKLVDRAKKELGDSVSDVGLRSLLEYSDLGDCLQLLRRGSAQFPAAIRGTIEQFFPKLESMIPIRNRVMHNRPLEWDDYSDSADLANKLIASQTDLWHTLRAKVKEFKQDPDAALRGNFLPTDNSKILHNLPSPDFDDTGFVGRSDVLRQTLAAIRGPYPIVTLTGEGGLGKTALALKACYDLLDDPNCSFEAIVWTSAKANRLTPGAIQEISNSITSSLGIFDAALEQLADAQVSNKLDHLISHLRDFPILLVIDNLETVLDENMRQLARKIPSSGSKVLFTTRIGMGAMDFPIPVPPLEQREASSYFRRVAQVMNVNDLKQLKEQTVREYTEKLQRNPLFIKWFVQAVRSGSRPAAILANPKMMLEFCFQNVFDKLDSAQRAIVDVLVCTKPPHTLTLLSYFTSMNFDELERSVAALIASNIIMQRVDRDGGANLMLAELARLYIINYARPSPKQQQDYERMDRQLTATNEFLSNTNTADRYDDNTLVIRGKYDVPAAQLLRRSLDHSRSGDFVEAARSWERAKQVAPDYYEVYRVGGFLHSKSGDFVLAEDLFSRAMALCATHAPLYFFFGNFILRQRNDAERAAEIFREGLEHEPGSIALKRSLALASLFVGNYVEAREIVSGLRGEFGLMPERQRRILVGVHLQSFTREFEREVRFGNHQVACVAMQGIKDVLTDYEQWIDQRNFSYIAKVQKEISQWIGATRFSKGVTDLRNWVSSILLPGIRDNTSLYRGTDSYDSDTEHDPTSREPDREVDESGGEGLERGVVDSKWGNYGFLLRSSDAPKLFFHRGSFLNRADFDVVERGTHVTFRIGKNYQGPIAVGAVIVAEPQAKARPRRANLKKRTK